ncbi:MAG: hypothetical protein WDZ90_01755 [Candidatus Paceibacterota bacterium]
MHILIHGADSPQRKTLHDQLARLGHATTEQTTPAQAEHAFGFFAFDLVITQWGETGPHLLQRMRETRNNTPVIITTGGGRSNKELEEIRTLGAKILENPVSRNDLEVAINELAGEK